MSCSRLMAVVAATHGLYIYSFSMPDKEKAKEE